jgi:hypothetical protein
MKILRDVSDDSHVLLLVARRLPPARRCRCRRRSYYEAHQHGTGRDSWDTKGRRKPHGQIRIRRVGGRATQIPKGRGTLGWIDRHTFDILHLRMRIFLWLWALRALSAGWSVDRTGPPCSSATDHRSIYGPVFYESIVLILTRLFEGKCLCS